MIEQHYGHMLAPHASRSRDIVTRSGADLDATWTQPGSPPISHQGDAAHHTKTAKPSNGLEPLTPPYHASQNDRPNSTRFSDSLN
jgi:hypothetical protein